MKPSLKLCIFCEHLCGRLQWNEIEDKCVVCAGKSTQESIIEKMQKCLMEIANADKSQCHELRNCARQALTKLGIEWNLLK